MAEEDGQVSMGRHLAAVKLEAAEMKYALEQQVETLKQMVSELEVEGASLAAELEHCQSHIEKLKVENSTKYRMEER